MARVAIIDLGSNTFHILIAKVTPSGFKEIYRERQYVFLSEKGVDTIAESAFQRGIDCLLHFSQLLKEYQVSDTKIIGTATLRKASNGSAFVTEVDQKYGLQIETISGAKEASLIAKGVMLSLPNKHTPSLIMDIGGGSVEFIICVNGEVVWQRSYPIGLSIIYQQYQKSDPISKTDAELFTQFLDVELAELTEQVAKHQPTQLIGASGSFEVLRDMAAGVIRDKEHPTYTVSSISFRSLASELYSMSLDHRLQLEKLPKSRAKYIAIAMLLVEYIVDSFIFEEIIISEYAIKEGLLTEYM